MTAPLIDEVEVQAGASWRRSYPVFDSSGNGPVDDLADWTIRATVRAARSSSLPALFTWSTGDDGAGAVEIHRREAVNAAGLRVVTDHFRLILTPAQSASFAWPFGVALVELARSPTEIGTPVALHLTVRSETTTDPDS